jgi:hypothetical protein
MFSPVFFNADSRAITPDIPGSVNLQTSASRNAFASPGYIHNSAVMPVSVPADQFLNSNRYNDGSLETTRMGGQQPVPSRNADNGDWTTSTTTQRRKWGPFGGDVSRSEGQRTRRKRKASYDAPEKTRKMQKYLGVSHPEGQPYASTSTTTSDARCVGFGSPQEVVPVYPHHHHLSNGLTGFPARENFKFDQAITREDQRSLHESRTTQEQVFEEYLNPRERFEDMFDIARIPTRHPRFNLDHDRFFQQGRGEIFSPRQGQRDLAESFAPHLDYRPERLEKYLQFNSFSDLDSESQPWTLFSEC